MPRTSDACASAFCPLSKPATLPLRPLAFAGFVLLLFTFYQSLATNALAQSTTATLSGVVKDQAGSVVVGANIAVISIAQGFVRSTTTSSEGFFIVPSLSPGVYTLKVEHEGFNTFERRDVVLNVNDQVVINISLTVGDLKDVKVEVTDASPLIDDSAAVGTTVDRNFVNNMPLSGRSLQPLINLSPGVVLTKATSSESGQFSVNGQRANANYFTIDGVSANIGVSVAASPTQAATGSLPGLSASGGTNNLVSIDALQEFKIQTSTYAAEFGRTAGAQVQLVTRAGTSQFHGTAFEILRNEAFEANDWFNNARKLAKPATRQSDFGFVLGGPILLPRFGEGGRQPWFHGRKSTFFFFSYEGLRLRLPQSRSVDVASLAARQNAPQAVRPILNAYSLPNGPNRIGPNGQPNGLAVFNASYSNPADLDATSIRLDHTVNNRLTLFGRYNYSPSSVIERGQSNSFTVNTLSHYAVTTQTLTGGATMIFSPKINNEIRLNHSKNIGQTFFDIDDLSGAVPFSDSLLFPSGTSRERDLVTVFLSGSVNTAFQIGTTASNFQRQFNAIDNLSIIHNAHQLKFGVDYRRLTPIIEPQNYSLFIQFNGVGTPGAPAPTAGSILSGVTQGGTIRSSIGPRFPVFRNLSLYGQDNWRATSRLTINYGLRWEFNPPPTEGNGQEAITVIGLDNPATLTVAPAGTPLWNTQYANFAPRLGLAYQLFQKPGRETVLRGGAGIFYDLGYGSIGNAFGNNAYPYSASRPLGIVPFPISASNSTAPTVPNLAFLFVFDPDIKLPRTYQWNFSAEQSLGLDQSLTVSYVAALGRKLIRQDTLFGTQFGGPLNSAVFPASAQVIVARNTATSDYHALQAQFQRRLSKGFQALASYTWSHSIDIASNDSSNINTPATRIDPRTDRGASDFDIRHAFNAALTYDIAPLFRNGAANAIFRDWSIDALFTARSATPVNVTHSVVLPGLGVLSLRPDLVLGIPLYIDDPTAPGGRRFNNTPATIPGNPNPQVGPFVRPFPSRQGSFGRNVLRGFPVHQLDFAVRRQFNLGERVDLLFKTEFFNIFNHPNFGDPDSALLSSTFGLSNAMFGRSLGSGGTLGGFNPLYQIGGPRSIQFSLKLGF